MPAKTTHGITTQLLAAESAKLSFGTYRRRLDELATTLWLQEQALTKG